MTVVAKKEKEMIVMKSRIKKNTTTRKTKTKNTRRIARKLLCSLLKQRNKRIGKC